MVLTSSAFSQSALTALEEAIAKGALRVKYEDKEVTYRDLDEMLKIRDLMRQALGIDKSPRGVRRIAQSNKGLG